MNLHRHRILKVSKVINNTMEAVNESLNSNGALNIKQKAAISIEIAALVSFIKKLQRFKNSIKLI